MCLKLGQGVHSHLAQCTVEQALSLLLLFLATPRQGSRDRSSPFALGYTLSRLWYTGRGWGARLFLWGSWGWTQAILHGNCWGRNLGSSQMILHVEAHPHISLSVRAQESVHTLLQHAYSHALGHSQISFSCHWYLWGCNAWLTPPKLRIAKRGCLSTRLPLW